jgi:1-deoxy-D-xylulose 5-phosphate reductoisomerase
MDIPYIIESVLSTSKIEPVESISQLVEIDKEARKSASMQLKSISFKLANLKLIQPQTIC